MRSETIEALIADNRIAFSAKECVAFSSISEIFESIRLGRGPKDGNGRQLLREDLPDLEFWVGKPIGLGRPSRKAFWDEKKSKYKPVSSMIIGTKSARDDALHELTSDKQGKATGEVQEIFQSKVFNFPKPCSLIKGLINSAVGDDALVLDFFAGSATTAQAVMELNAEDGGNRRFIIVSSTEATEDDPDKNLCRDVTAERIRLLNASDDKKYADLAAGFAYLRTHEIAFEDLDYDLQPADAWAALEAMHDLPLTLYDGSAPWNLHEGETTALVLVDRFDPGLLDWLKGRDRQNLFVYSWAPGQIAQHLDGTHVDIRSVRDTLVRRFQQ